MFNFFLYNTPFYSKCAICRRCQHTLVEVYRSWLSTRWNEEWRDAEHSRLHSFINTPDHVPGQDLPRRQWTTYNRIRTGVGRFGEAMKRWGLKSTSECECGAPNQSVQHIMDDCTMHRPPNGERGLTDLDEDTRIWLASTSLEI